MFNSLNNNMDYRQINYHHLYELSNRISSNELEDLKYLCQDVSEAKINRVTTPFQLFQVLEECGKLSVNDTEYLADLLVAIRRSDLVALLVNGSVSSIAEETCSSYVVQQPVYNSGSYYDHSRSAYNQTSYQSQFGYHYPLHNNAATPPPPLHSIEEQCHSLPWDASTRGASARRTSAEVLPQSAHILPAILPSPLDSMRTPGDQHQWVNKQLSSVSYYQQEESTSYRSEPLSAHSVQQEYNSAVSVYTNNERYNSAPLTNDSSGQQTELGLLATTNQFHYWSNHSHASSTFSPTHSAPVAVNHQHEEVSLPTQAIDDDAMATYPYTNRTVDMEVSRSEIYSLQQANQILIQEVKILKQQYEQMQQEHKQMCERLLRQQPNAQCCPRYLMDKSPHGIAVIINNHKFYSNDPNKRPMANRRGSQVDEDNLHALWRYLQYDVHILKNCTAHTLLDELAAIASQNHNNYDSFVCCILSHGYSDGVYGADGQQVKIKDIANLFEQTRTLFGKPKMFFIQACRGEDEDKGIFLCDDVQKDGRDDSKDSSLPSDADFLFAYSAAPGKASYRSQKYGSWYISILCQVFEHYAHLHDLLSMLTIVNDELSKADFKDGYKQCPGPVNFLRKQVWFLENMCTTN